MRCAVPVAPLRRGPSDDAEQVTEALLGEPLVVVDVRGAWARVRTAYDYPGWIRLDAVEDGEGRVESDCVGQDPLEVARRYVGAPYLWGGMTRAGIDCSGLVHMAFRRTGRLVPRDAAEQELVGRTLEGEEPGALVSYGEPGAAADHVAFWAGGGVILHATGRERLGVVEEPEPVFLRPRRRRIFAL